MSHAGTVSRRRPPPAAGRVRWTWSSRSEAAEALRDDPREAKLHAVLATTYFHRVPTQATAAQRLGLPFSTYRRHLERAQQRVCELLWRRETTPRVERPH
ncbi:hypothetical protein [Actinoplanes teichomyceticus]|uniref:Sigma-70-like protein n=1 Tax=Actinoplanes teichomyceticus TaxID=1867 RepID=A0A561VCU7_ACTTI|nr:hypothetical protein [Actinoplanes teichomyceticus]TWG09429.1 hypothetical protein FHX34_108144 [Actinoplanes teichomyceticus]GIF17096.1 hypothetical protein Ate01nite_71280 [Actinoplanes teichomyceticus]